MSPCLESMRSSYAWPSVRSKRRTHRRQPGGPGENSSRREEPWGWSPHEALPTLRLCNLGMQLQTSALFLDGSQQ